jgi:serine/threonine-protein kinase
VADEIIGGYRLQRLMAQGQTSQVWEVVEVNSNRHFAMKLLLPEKAKEREFRHQLLHEANVGIAMRHPNVIKIVTVGKDPHNPYYVMEYFPAGSLKLRIMHKEFDFIREKAHDIFRQAATALAYISSSGWVHRDVKPDNFLVNGAGELRVIDFALAVRARKAGLFSKLFKKRGKTAGTPSYMSPEQIRNQPLDVRADVYSFGASAYEIATGRTPFRGVNTQNLLEKHFIEKPSPLTIYNADVTNEFSDLVLRCLAKKREGRPKDFHEVLIALRNIRVYKGEQPKKKAE